MDPVQTVAKIQSNKQLKMKRLFYKDIISVLFGIHTL